MRWRACVRFWTTSLTLLAALLFASSLSNFLATDETFCGAELYESEWKEVKRNAMLIIDGSLLYLLWSTRL
jgi:hypothetical protein